MLLNRIYLLFSGLRDSLRFSNRGEVVLQRLMSRNRPILHYEWQNKWHLYCDSRYADHGSPKELLARAVYNSYIKQSSQSGSCNYVNVGAHIGAFDVAVAALGMAVSYALSVELNPRTFTRLAFNVTLNQLESIRLRNAGIAGSPGSYRFTYREGSNSVSDNIFVPEGVPDDRGADVDLLTLQQALNEAGMGEKTFDMLKLDCEGAEYDIVQNSSPELLRRFAHILMEIHAPPENRNPEKLYSKLFECGFRGGDPKWTVEEGPSVRFWKRVD